jgi:uncharacterized membrane protein
MKSLAEMGRIFYGSAIAATGSQQFFFKDFFQIIFPPLPFRIPGLIYFAYLVAAILFLAGTAVALNVKAKYFAYLLGSLFLFFFIFWYIPYELFINPYSPWHLGLWTSAGKELAYAGGAFVIAGQALLLSTSTERKSSLIRFLENVVPFGPFMFGVTMLCFGIDHFLYTTTVENMVPDWISNHVFWTYLAGICLIGSAIAIIVKFRLTLTANLLATMIFLWFVFLHIPDAIANPVSNNGNEVTSAFSALAFSGIAFVIANSRGTPVRTRV